ncbi:Gfo/Idh/MocA family protein [Allonocardiopsis opalescens]|uniref:Putative dehydrogenase n=1 Tax=Allonocardiopsis opalescens TaxID=1144618 RepID=A0A2T0PXZ8_9ACTN|nr:Gfo/Idh/MocA family oxidoreductase [Allonocardiopsis opalescens]PRX96286.1 putative dehydrogenase [Allonocardiopsis opalescens]
MVVRIGVLGAARITPLAVLRPAARTERVEVHAVAARDRSRAEAFAARHGIPVVHDTYAELLEDPAVTAVYNPLPNALHAEWTIAALRAGKHVLCEKPLAANAAEAERVAEAAEETGLVVMEAFHYRYHPLAARMYEIVHELRELGEVHRVEASMCIPLPLFDDIRYDAALAGGATMDAGCYAVHVLRLLGSGEPTVAGAQAQLRDPRVDRAMSAEFTFSDGSTGGIEASMWSHRLLSIHARAVGERGELNVTNYLAPQFGHGFAVTVDGVRRRERFSPAPTYAYQLRAFADAVESGTPVLTGPRDGAANMRVIDEIYRAAGLWPRDGLVETG